jgi:adenylate cyclase
MDGTGGERAGAATVSVLPKRTPAVHASLALRRGLLHTSAVAKVGDFLRSSVKGIGLMALILLFALLVVSDYGLAGFSRIVDQRGGDLLLALNARERAPSDRVVIIDIDQRSLEQMNELAGSWPWPRSVHGELIDYLARQKPRTIAFDILFNELDVYRPEHDAAFADAVARNPNVWLAMTLNADGDGALGQGHASVDRHAAADEAASRCPGAADDAAGRRATTRGDARRADQFHRDSDGVGRHHELYATARAGASPRWRRGSWTAWAGRCRPNSA